jgi:hypothetical protein
MNIQSFVAFYKNPMDSHLNIQRFVDLYENPRDLFNIIYISSKPLKKLILLNNIVELLLACLSYEC